jgi:endonuclease/exonuclease/phosphatase family metal-dependent hydrolase
MLGAGYVDAFRICGPASTGYTFPTWDPHVRLDYAFAPKAFADRVLTCRVVGGPPDVKTASDHFPLRIDLGC